MKIIDAIRDKAVERAEKKDEKDLVSKIYGIFEEYRSDYAAEWLRLERCERYYRGEHWEEIETKDENEPRPVTNVIQSTIENIAADLMDNYPEAVITPESSEDETVAMILQEIIKQNHDAAGYIKEYARLSHDLLAGGYMVQEVGYDSDLNSGIGGAFIRHVDNNNIMFDPLCTDIQDGRAAIKFEGLPRKVMDQRFPHLAPFKSDQYVTESKTVSDDPFLTQDTEKMVLLIEYWWREYDDEQRRYTVHMCKVAGGKIVEDSRREKPNGYYAHGEYPFVITPLFTRKGSALGLGFVDMFADRQKTADKLDQIILKNAYMASHNKMLVSKSSGFDIDDLRDWSREVHEGMNIQGVTWYPTPPLPQYIYQYVQMIRQSIKDESGSNDFSRGTVGGGVTAASAIAALQEMSSKRSRMASRQMQEAFKDAVRMEIEVEREFNILPREVVITRSGQQEKATFESALLTRQSETGAEVPMEFYVSIKVQRENRYSVMAQNELILQMVQLGVIRPDQALELMQFDGKEGVIKRNMEAQQGQQPTEEEMIRMAEQEQMNNQMQTLPSPDNIAPQQMVVQ